MALRLPPKMAAAVELADVAVEIGRVSSCLNAWRDFSKVRKFYKVCVFAFRERALIRTTRVALLHWRDHANETREKRHRHRERMRGRREEEQERVASAFASELEKLKMQAAFNFFATNFLRRRDFRLLLLRSIIHLK